MLAKTCLLGLSVLVTIAAVLLLLHNPKVGELFHLHVRDRPKRRLPLAAYRILCHVAVARSMPYAAYRNAGPFHYVYIRGTHIHHLVWGILLLLAVGFCWLLEVGDGSQGVVSLAEPFDVLALRCGRCSHARRLRALAKRERFADFQTYKVASGTDVPAVWRGFPLEKKKQMPFVTGEGD